VERRGGTCGAWARLIALGGLALLAGCATPPKFSELALRPTPQQPLPSQIVGERIVAGLGGADITVEYLPKAGVEHFYAEKPGLVNPFPDEVWAEAPPTVFALRVRNGSGEPLQFDPGMSLLSSDSGRHLQPLLYDDLYERLIEMKDSARRLQSLQATLLDRLLVIAPGGQREGLLVFLPFDPRAKQLTLELSSLYVTGKLTPAFFTFQVELRKAQ
jgi:hypothetical protein